MANQIQHKTHNFLSLQSDDVIEIENLLWVVRFNHYYGLKVAIIYEIRDGSELYYLIKVVQLRFGWCVILYLFRVDFMMSLELGIRIDGWFLELVHHLHELLVNQSRTSLVLDLLLLSHSD